MLQVDRKLCVYHNGLHSCKLKMFGVMDRNIVKQDVYTEWIGDVDWCGSEQFYTRQKQIETDDLSQNQTRGALSPKLMMMMMMMIFDVTS